MPEDEGKMCVYVRDEAEKGVVEGEKEDVCGLAVVGN
jgi:hypothetical protein